MHNQPFIGVVVIAGRGHRMCRDPLAQQLALRVLVAIVIIAAQDVELEVWCISEAGDLMAALFPGGGTSCAG